MILSPLQIAQLAAGAGFSGPALPVSVAIALAESRPPGNTESQNPELQAGTAPGRGSFGLWQIYRTAHPEFDGVDLYDPQANARAAYSVFVRAGGFLPWSSYKNGRYRQFLPAAQDAVDALISPAIDPGPAEVLPAQIAAQDQSQAVTAGFPALDLTAGSPVSGSLLFLGLGLFLFFLLRD